MLLSRQDASHVFSLLLQPHHHHQSLHQLCISFESKLSEVCSHCHQTSPRQHCLPMFTANYFYFAGPESFTVKQTNANLTKIHPILPSYRLCFSASHKESRKVFLRIKSDSPNFSPLSLVCFHLYSHVSRLWKLLGQQHINSLELLRPNFILIAIL